MCFPQLSASRPHAATRQASELLEPRHRYEPLTPIGEDTEMNDSPAQAPATTSRTDNSSATPKAESGVPHPIADKLVMIALVLGISFFMLFLLVDLVRGFLR
jgi:hypothetical protein